MQLEGDLRDTPALSLLLELAREKFTGAVSFEHQSIIRIIYFREGDIIASSATEQEESIDQILVNAGKISRDHARQAVSRRRESEAIAETLLSLGFVTRKEIHWARRVQLVALVRSVIGWSEGSFSLLENYAPARDEGLLFHLPQIVVEAIITSTDRERIERETGGGEAVYARADGFEEHYQHLGLNEDADAVVRRIDGTRTASELASFSSEDSFTVFKLLRALEVMGLLSRVDQPQALPEVSKPQVTPHLSDFVPERDLDVASLEPDLGNLEAEPAQASVVSYVAASGRPWGKIAVVSGLLLLTLAIAALVWRDRRAGEGAVQDRVEPVAKRPAAQPPVVQTVTAAEAAAQTVQEPPNTAPSVAVPPIAERRTQNAERRTSVEERRTPNADPVAPNAEPVPQNAERRTQNAERGRFDSMARRFREKHATTPYALQIELVCQTGSITRALEIGGEKIWFIPIQFRGQPCYRVFWGSYETRAAAEQAVADVPGVFLAGGRPAIIEVRQVLGP